MTSSGDTTGTGALDHRAALYGFPVGRVAGSKSQTTEVHQTGAISTGLTSVIGHGMQLSEGGVAASQQDVSAGVVGEQFHLCIMTQTSTQECVFIFLLIINMGSTPSLASPATLLVIAPHKWGPANILIVLPIHQLIFVGMYKLLSSQGSGLTSWTLDLLFHWLPFSNHWLSAAISDHKESLA